MKDENIREMASLHKIAFIGNYVPRCCGIATFTTDLCRAVSGEYPNAQCIAIAVNDGRKVYKYPQEVRFEIEEEDLSSYQRAAEFLNISNVDIVCLQHEFGIFGGEAGSHVLALMHNIKAPLVTTLHTVLTKPTNDQLTVMKEIIQHSSRLVVMTERAVTLMKEIYQVPADKIDTIPHGIPDMPFVDPNYYKDSFGVEGKIVLLTFGLISPNKGIEFVLDALPSVIAEFPNLVYIVLGATHPNLVHSQGEVYRLGLERRAIENGIEKNVIFYNRYVDLTQLIEFISAADIYITPYLTEAQIVSGTLAYSFGSGKAVVSTPYWHAQELLTGNRGVLVPFSNSPALAEAVIYLLKNEVERHIMRKNAYILGRDMVWKNIAPKYWECFENSKLNRGVISRNLFDTKTLDKQGMNLPRFKFDHLRRMVDSTGLFQHAVYTVPNFGEGYCTDDNARCLILTILLEELGIRNDYLKSIASTCAAFLNYALDRNTGRFRNFMGFDRKWKERQGSDDSHGRAIWALGVCIARSQNRGLRNLAGQLWELALPATAKITSPRACAFSLIGIQEYLLHLRGDRYATQLRSELTERLVNLHRQYATDDWPWFEDIVSYSNAKLPHALIMSGHWTGNAEVLQTGLTALSWLCRIQTSEGGYFRPIGCNGFYRRGNIQASFDQQPVQSSSMISACIEAYNITGEKKWLKYARLAFDWFLGRNDLGVPLYDPENGGCSDALHIDRVNENQGAESTLAFLLSLAEMQLVQNRIVAFNKPSIMMSTSANI